MGRSQRPPVAKEGETRYPVIATVPLPPAIARDFLNRANDGSSPERVVLIGRRDFSVLLDEEATDEEIQAIDLFAEEEPHETKVMKRFFTRLSRRSDLGAKAFIELDEVAVNDKICLVSSEAKLDNDKFAPGLQLSFRAGFDDALPALMRLQTSGKTARQHRHEAVRCGGVWNMARVQEFADSTSGLDIASLPAPPAEEPERKGKWQHIPVFRTADISLETLNRFIKEVYDYKKDEEEDEEEGDDGPLVAFVTRHDKKLFTQREPCKADTVLEDVPPLSQAFKYASPEECGQLIRRRMYAQRNLDTDYFIIMDRYTETEQTVVVACQSEWQNDGELNMVRCGFREVMVILLSVSEGGTSFEDIADEAARERDGVSHQMAVDDDEGGSGDDEGSGSDEWEDED